MRIRAVLAALLTVAIAALAAGCGEGDRNGSSPAGGGTRAAGNAIDRAFVAEMVPHHRLAIEMAAVARTDATSAFVKNLAADIDRTQTAEIATMRRIDAQLAAAGVKRGSLAMDDHAMGTDMDADRLRGAKPFDRKFIAMMVPHHEGAIAMARTELEQGQNAELKRLATAIVTAQQREVRQMRAHAKGGAASGEQGMDHSGGGNGA